MATLAAGTMILDIRLSANMQLGADFQNAVQDLSRTFNHRLAFGTGAGQFNQWFHDARVLAASANETLDLAGSLTNSMGQTVTFASIATIIIVNTNTAGDMLVGGAASNQFVNPLGDTSDKIRIKRSGFLILSTSTGAPYTVTGGSADNLKIDNEDSTNSLVYEIYLFGIE